MYLAKRTRHLEENERNKSTITFCIHFPKTQKLKVLENFSKLSSI